MFNPRSLLIRLAFIAVAFPGAAHAEKFDVEAINRLYEKINDDMPDTLKANYNLETRLAKDYKSIIKTTLINGKAAPVESEVMFNKDTTIAEAKRLQKLSTTFKYKLNVSAIQYSRDGLTAYVSLTSSRSGLMTVTLPNGQITSKPFETGMGCVDTLERINLSVTIRQSECRVRTIIGE